MMAEMPSLPHQQRNNNKPHKTPERNQQRRREQTSRTPSTKDLEQLIQQSQRESDTANVSTGRITTSPARSPTRNKRTSPLNSHSPQRHHQVLLVRFVFRCSFFVYSVSRIFISPLYTSFSTIVPSFVLLISSLLLLLLVCILMLVARQQRTHNPPTRHPSLPRSPARHVLPPPTT